MCVMDIVEIPPNTVQKIEILDEGISKRYEKEYCAHAVYIYIYIIETRLNKVTYLEKQNKTNHGSPLPHSEQVIPTPTSHPVVSLPTKNPTAVKKNRIHFLFHQKHSPNRPN